MLNYGISSLEPRLQFTALCNLTQVPILAKSD